MPIKNYRESYGDVVLSYAVGYAAYAAAAGRSQARAKAWDRGIALLAELAAMRTDANGAEVLP